MANKKISDLELKKIKGLRKKGLSILQISYELNRDKSTISKYIKQMGLKDKTIIDLTGQKFGKLTVLKLDHIEKSKKYWLCKCDCGKEKIVNGYSLKRGDTKSCGCLRKKGKSKAIMKQKETKEVGKLKSIN